MLEPGTSEPTSLSSTAKINQTTASPSSQTVEKPFSLSEYLVSPFVLDCKPELQDWVRQLGWTYSDPATVPFKFENKIRSLGDIIKEIKDDPQAVQKLKSIKLCTVGEYEAYEARCMHERIHGRSREEDPGLDAAPTARPKSP